LYPLSWIYKLANFPARKAYYFPFYVSPGSHLGYLVFLSSSDIR
jgi:hypothetical protein